MEGTLTWSDLQRCCICPVTGFVPLSLIWLLSSVMNCSILLGWRHQMTHPIWMRLACETPSESLGGHLYTEGTALIPLPWQVWRQHSTPFWVFYLWIWFPTHSRGLCVELQATRVCAGRTRGGWCLVSKAPAPASLSTEKALVNVHAMGSAKDDVREGVAPLNQ